MRALLAPVRTWTNPPRQTGVGISGGGGIGGVMGNIGIAVYE